MMASKPCLRGHSSLYTVVAPLFFTVRIQQQSNRITMELDEIMAMARGEGPPDAVKNKQKEYEKDNLARLLVYWKRYLLFQRIN